jgi:transcriptional regulator with XRE-family HTH domain
VSSVVVDADLATLGREIQRIRKASGLSQEELAEKAGLTRNYIGFIERGERNASTAAIIKIARALSVPPADLFATLS